MNRRGLFKLLAGATAAAAMHVTGLKSVKAPQVFKSDFVCVTDALFRKESARLLATFSDRDRVRSWWHEVVKIPTA